MALLWTFTDQQSIRKISANNQINWEQLAEEVQFVKLKDLMGADFYQDVISNPTGTWNKKLIDGGTYEVGDVTYEYGGLKAVLSYLFFERYIMESDIQDTFSGMKKNDIDEAVHLGLNQKKGYAQEMNRVAIKHWEDALKFVCENSSEFPYAKVKTSKRIKYY